LTGWCCQTQLQRGSWHIKVSSIPDVCCIPQGHEDPCCRVWWRLIHCTWDAALHSPTVIHVSSATDA